MNDVIFEKARTHLNYVCVLEDCLVIHHRVVLSAYFCNWYSLKTGENCSKESHRVAPTAVRHLCQPYVGKRCPSWVQYEASVPTLLHYIHVYVRGFA